MKSTVIISAKAGRLGNRLFLSAYFMANALRHGYGLMNPALGEYAECFEGSAGDPWCGFPHAGATWEPEFASQCREVMLMVSSATSRMMRGRTIDIRSTFDTSDAVYDLNSESYLKLVGQGGVLFAKGWKFRDDVNLVSYRRIIADYFAPIRPIREKAENVVSRARHSGSPLIGVHIRQGDYRGWKDGAHYFETTQYAHWMSEVTALYSGEKPTFLICSSDPVDFRQFGHIPVVRGPGEVVADLHALSLCDAIMGPPSTFSTWASYCRSVPLCMLQNHRQQISRSDFVMHDRV